MIHNCGKILQINYKESCCLKHLIEMSEQAQIQLLTNKYAKLLLKTLYHLSQNNQLPLDGLNLDIASPFLEILSKYSSHFFFLNKYSHCKILCKVAMQVSEATIYREHPDIIFRICAIRNNLACVYEKEGKYQRSLTELSNCKKYLCHNKDKVIFYNNYISIQMKTGNLKVINDSLVQLKKCLFEEMDKIKSDNLYKHIITNQEDIKLISVVMYNSGYCLENLQRLKEAKEIFKMGFEFTICMLGENNYYAEKYNNKIDKYALNKLDSNVMPIESEDEIIIEEVKKKKMTKAQNANLNLKLEMILNKLESIGNKFEKNELTANDQQEIYNQAMKIKEMLSENNPLKAKESRSSKPKLNKIESTNSKQTNSSTNIKNKEIENISAIQSDNNTKSFNNSFLEGNRNSNNINLNSKQEQINLLDVDLLLDYQNDHEFKFNPLENSTNNATNTNFPNNKINFDNSSNANQAADKKPKIVPSIQIPKICLDSINTDNRYECETFYQKNENKSPLVQNNNSQFNIKIDLDENGADNYQCVTFYMKKLASSRVIQQSETELIEDETKVSALIIKIQFQDFNINDYFDDLIKPNGSKTPRKLKVFRFINNAPVILCLQLLSNSLDISIETESIKVRFDYDNLKKCLSQIMIKHSLPYLGLFSEIKTIEDFTHKILSHYISCRYQDGYKFGISKNPIGVFTKKAINFTIRFSKCTFDMLVFSKKSVRLLIYSSSNEDQSIEIDSIFDEESFNDLFKMNSPILPESSTSNQYSMKSDDYAQDEVLMKLGKNIQKLVNAFCTKRYNTFEDFCNDKNLRFKCVIKAHCDDIELTISDFNEKLFKVIQLTSKVSIHSEGIIYSCDLNSIFGYETKMLYNMTNYYEKTFICQMILSSIEKNMNTSKLQLCAWTIVSHYNFTLNGRICNVTHINLRDKPFLLMKMYYPITFHEHCKLLVPNKKVKAFDFLRLQTKLNKIFVCSLANMNKLKDKYLEIIEL